MLEAIGSVFIYFMIGLIVLAVMIMTNDNDKGGLV